MMISFEKWEELIKNGYSLDILYLLKLVKDGYDIKAEGAKFKNIWNSMERKGLVNGGKVTLQGDDLLAFLSNKEEIPKLKRKKFIDEAFDKWWKAYPATDTFSYNNRKFTGTRALRVKKDDCRAKINKILNTGEYNIEELIQAIHLEVQQKVENSVKTNQNKLSYMQNSLTYLNQATYDPFVELVRAGHKAEEENQSTTEGVEI